MCRSSLKNRFPELRSFEFFEDDPATGRVREFDERFGPEAKQRYFERVYDVADEIFRILTDFDADEKTLARKIGKTVFLAATTSDLQSDVDRIRRELIDRGHEVLPDRPLPLVGSQLEPALQQYLDRCDLAIHPIGSVYGIVPEGSDLSLVELQNSVAAQQFERSAIPRIIWLPRDAQPRMRKQEDLIKAILEDPVLHRGAEVVRDNLESLKAVMLDKLAPLERPRTSVEQVAESAAKRIYLICDRNDETAVEPLEDYLFEQGFDVSLPDFQANESEAVDIHRQNLLDCDAVLIYYGAARHSWVDIKLRNVLKVSGYGRSGPMRAQAVWVAPPLDRRKERFRSQVAEVLRQEDSFNPALLEGFRCASQAGGGGNQWVVSVGLTHTPA